jgi:DNA-binding NarL/FixJ family response regulator
VALTQTAALRPDVVLMDIRMPAMDGIQATEAIVRAGLAQVLVLTAFGLDAYVLGALRAGAAGFLLKTVGQHELCEAVLRVAGGDGALAPEVTRAVIAHIAGGDGRPTRARTAEELPAWWRALTPRERDVLRCLVAGRSNADIAAELSISVPTAKTHVSKVLEKMGCTSRLQAAVLAQEVSGLES